MASLVRFLYSGWEYMLASLGLLNKEGQLLVVGLDCAGKTTLLQRLRGGESSLQTLPPTDRPSRESFTYNRLKFEAWDLGGHEAVRHLWMDYLTDQISALIFVVDAADGARLLETQYELEAMVHEIASEESEVVPPIAILYNKCDLPNALTDEELEIGLELKTIRNSIQNCKTFRVSVLQGSGYQQALQWVGSFL